MDNQKINLVIEDSVYQTLPTNAYKKALNWKKQESNKITAIIPGTIVEIFVKEGQSVNDGDPMLVIEAMKMNNKINFTHSGIVDKIYVKPGDVVAKDQILVSLR